MAVPGPGRIGLWLHLRRGNQVPLPEFDLPPGSGPILVMRTCAEAEVASAQVRRRLLPMRPGLRIVAMGEAGCPDTSEDLARSHEFLERTRPFAVLLLGSDLPAGLVTAAFERQIPLIMAEAHFQPSDTGWRLRALMRRELLARIGAVMVSDEASYRIAHDMGVQTARLTMTGPVTRIMEPLPCIEAERALMAQLLAGRHAWLAASIPPEEEDAVIEAHLNALRLSHRALLFLVPSDMDRADSLAAEIEARGLIVARRTADEEPVEEVQVMVSDGPTEMGLWYRLAPVTYMGGTLSGHASASRHPFEPAALGSAIVHGPTTARHATEWRQLDGANAARPVADAADLVTAIGDLSQAEQVATLASNAWQVSTGGAGVAMQIVAPVLAALEASRP